VREIVGFVMGAAAGAAGALFASSTEGRALIERIRDEARPEVDRAATEWEPVLREVGRAVRLAARELETATADLRSRIGEIAAALPDDRAAGVGALPDVAAAVAAEVAPIADDVAPPVAAADAVAPAEPAAEPTMPELALDAATADLPPAGAPVTDDTTPGA
jgi:hypothetical protein